MGELVADLARRSWPEAPVALGTSPGSPLTLSGTETADSAEALSRNGFVVLDGLFPQAAIQEARRSVLKNAGLLRNTRPNPSAGHLAGFHRYPVLEHLHAMLSTNPRVLGILEKAAGSPGMRSIGLSDITINRSQEWHVDLLRGKYRYHLNPDICWGVGGGGVYKVLLYLQPGQSLRVISGAHVKVVPLDTDRASQPKDPSEVTPISVAAGAVILMDIRLPHRGSSDEELDNGDYSAFPKILISTVLGSDGKPLTGAMEKGNFERLLEWDAQHKEQGRRPQLPLNSN